jgi:hypothetical protein
VIDDALLKEAMQATGLTTKCAVVEAGLQLLVQIKAHTDIRRLRRTSASGKAEFCSQFTGKNQVRGVQSVYGYGRRRTQEAPVSGVEQAYESVNSV